MNAPRRFFPAVDGLRAIAVLCVVAFHIGLPFVPGGYVGVDVFFVISGFLIIGHIAADVRAGTFRFAAFYARRAMRILPSYFLVIIACALIAPFVLVIPAEWRSFGAQVLWSGLMMANHYFLASQSYFDAASDLKPLLNLWSLGVEEQFYALAPLVVVLCAALWRGRVSRLAVVALLGACFAASLWFCVALTRSGLEKNVAFFLMPLRAWEFMAGGVLALTLGSLQRLPDWLGSAAVWLGLLLIGLAVTLFSVLTPFPSYHVILPVAGACLVIAGAEVAPRAWPVRAITVRPMLWIGLVSYAWYLWHWPLLTFGRLHHFSERSLPLDILMGLLSLGFAVLTYLFLERPIARWRQGAAPFFRSWKPSVLGIGASMVVVALGVFLGNSVPEQVAATIPPGLRPEKFVQEAGPCRLEEMGSADACLAATGRLRTGVLLGDSHALAAYGALNDAALENRSSLAVIGPVGCLPTIGTRSYRDGIENEPCLPSITQGFGWLTSGRIKPEFAILHARWAFYAPASGRPVGSTVHASIGLAEALMPSPDQHRVFVDQLRATFQALRAAGVAKILVIGPVPELYHRAPECLVRADKRGIDRDIACAVPREDADQHRQTVMTWLTEAMQGDPQVRLADPLRAFCDAVFCRPYRSDTALYRDDDHLSDDGAIWMTKAMKPDLDWAMAR
jgi:peptidoglycan/LPS O-acetylase OafA/YrhL